MAEVTTATPVPDEASPPSSSGTPRWWVAIHLLALLLTVVDAMAGRVPLVSFRIGQDGSPSATLTGYATAAVLYALVWRRAARGRSVGLVLLKTAFALVAVFVAVSLASFAGLGNDDWSSQVPLQSPAISLAQDVIVVAALALLFRNYRDLPTQRIPDRGVTAMSVGVLLVALVAGPVAATVAGRTATPAQARTATGSLLDEPTLADAADRVRDRVTWHPWERWAIVESGYRSQTGSGEGVGAVALETSVPEDASSWLVVSYGGRQVCLLQDGDRAPVRRGPSGSCRGAL